MKSKFAEPSMTYAFVRLYTILQISRIFIFVDFIINQADFEFNSTFKR